jgi:hypothetical protein
MDDRDTPNKGDDPGESDSIESENGTIHPEEEPESGARDTSGGDDEPVDPPQSDDKGA